MPHLTMDEITFRNCKTLITTKPKGDRSDTQPESSSIKLFGQDQVILQAWCYLNIIREHHPCAILKMTTYRAQEPMSGSWDQHSGWGSQLFWDRVKNLPRLSWDFLQREGNWGGMWKAALERHRKQKEQWNKRRGALKQVVGKAKESQAAYCTSRIRVSFQVEE